MSQREVFEWVETFKSNEWVETFKSKTTSVLDKAEAGHLSTLCTHNHIENANTFI
jgi:hypothetical protein